MDYEACVGLSRAKIRELSKFIRNVFKIKTLKFPVLKFLCILEKKYEDILYVAIEPDDYFEDNDTINSYGISYKIECVPYFD